MFTQPDVITRCTKCDGPIFNQSLNAKPVNGLHVDGRRRQKHRKCPEKREC